MRWLAPLFVFACLGASACRAPAPDPRPESAPERAVGPAPDPDKVRRAESRFRYRDGLKHLEAKRLDEALASFRDAERLDATYADPHRMLAGVLLRQGDRPAACAAMERYVELAKTPEALRKDVLEATCGAD